MRSPLRWERFRSAELTTTMTDADDDATNQTTPIRDRCQRRRRIVAVAVLAAVAIVAVAAWLGFRPIGSGSEPEDPLASPAVTAAESVLPPVRHYSDEELGIDDLIDEEIVPFETRYRDLAEWEISYDERQRYLEDEATGHERERLYFERNVEWLLSSEYETLPSDLGHGGILERAFANAMSQCAEKAGWPELEFNVSSTADIHIALRAIGLTHDEFLDLRHECAKQAASYPTLDPAVRDELLGRLREHYRLAVYEYLREFPDAEVPLFDHEGAPRPLEDRLIDNCLKSPDPPACAEEFRVELPVE